MSILSSLVFSLVYCCVIRVDFGYILWVTCLLDGPLGHAPQLDSVLSPAVSPDAHDSSPWMDSRPISYFTVLGTVGRLCYHHPVCSIPWQKWGLSTAQCGAQSRPKMCSWMSLYRSLQSLRTWKLLSWRTLPCDDRGSVGVGIQMSGKLSAVFPCDNELGISVKEICLFCYPQILVVV